MGAQQSVPMDLDVTSSGPYEHEPQVVVSAANPSTLMSAANPSTLVSSGSHDQRSMTSTSTSGRMGRQSSVTRGRPFTSGESSHAQIASRSDSKDKLSKQMEMMMTMFQKFQKDAEKLNFN